MSFVDRAAWMLRCHTGWPRLDELKRSSMEALQLPPSWKIQQDSDRERPAAAFILTSGRGLQPPTAGSLKPEICTFNRD